MPAERLMLAPGQARLPRHVLQGDAEKPLRVVGAQQIVVEGDGVPGPVVAWGLKKNDRKLHGPPGIPAQHARHRGPYSAIEVLSSQRVSQVAKNFQTGTRYCVIVG